MTIKTIFRLLVMAAVVAGSLWGIVSSMWIDTITVGDISVPYGVFSRSYSTLSSANQNKFVWPATSLGDVKAPSKLYCTSSGDFLLASNNSEETPVRASKIVSPVDTRYELEYELLPERSYSTNQSVTLRCALLTGQITLQPSFISGITAFARAIVLGFFAFVVGFLCWPI